MESSCHAEVLIVARPAAVWDVLTDVGNYAVWDSGVGAASGELRNGGRIRLRTPANSTRTIHFRVHLVPGQFMTWTRGAPLGLGQVVRTVSLADHAGFTHLTVSETARGPLRRLFSKSRSETKKNLRGFADAVKFRAELLSFHLNGGIFPTP